MERNVSDIGLEFITKHEGLVLRAYKDIGGIWTIGYGHTTAAGFPKVTAGMRITEKEARKILSQDLLKFGKRVNDVGLNASQHVFDGSVSFDYNTGGIKRATWVKRFKKGKFDEARISLNKWNKVKGEVIKGLVRRRKEEEAIIFDNQYPEYTSTKITKEAIEEAQTILTEKGFDLGAIDGIVGERTKAAVLAYQKLHPDLTNDGILGVATLSQLRRDSKLLKNLGKSMIKKGFPITAVTAILTDVLSFTPYLIAGVVVGLLLFYVVRNFDILERRLNKLFGREVV